MCHGHRSRAHTTSQVVSPTPPETRISDAERDAAADELRAHAAEGRLDMSELEARLELAYAAKTAADLLPLTADLPRYTVTQRAELARRGFREHLRSYVLVNLLLVAIWLVTDPGGHPWPIWSILGWGAGVASHAGGLRASRRPAPTILRA